MAFDRLLKLRRRLFDVYWPSVYGVYLRCVSCGLRRDHRSNGRGRHGHGDRQRRLARLTIDIVDEQSGVIATGTISGVLAPTGRRDLLGVTPMWDAVQLTFLPEPWLLAIHPASGWAATMIRWNGLFIMNAAPPSSLMTSRSPRPSRT